MEDRRQAGYIRYEVEEGVANITFYHPAHNSLPARLLEELTAAINRAGSDEEAKVVLLQSAGDRTFCAGASLDELAAIDNPKGGKAFFLGFANVINAIRKCPKFVLGRIQGKAIGGGVGLASAVDYCVATKYASVKLSELAIGIGPFVVGPAVARKIGQAAFQQLTINATGWQDAAWAREKGMYAEVFEDIAKMDQHLVDLIKQLASSNPEAMARLKAVFWEGTEGWDLLLSQRAAASGELVLSDFSRAAIAKFKAR